MKISIVYPHYLQHRVALQHIERWQAWPEELRQRLDFVIVDDHSTPPLAIPDVCLNLRLFRVTTDIIWNYGAKNLGVQKAHHQWVFLSELDHFLNEAAVRSMLHLAETTPEPTFYMFHRTGKKAIPHPATYLFNSRDFWNVNGVDEDFCGAYGHDDTYVVDCWERHGVRKVVPDGIVLDCVMGDATYEDAELWRLDSVPRDLSRNNKILGAKRKHNRISTSRIRFDWELVNEYSVDR